MPDLWPFSGNVKVPGFCSGTEQKYESKPLCFFEDAVVILISVFVIN